MKLDQSLYAACLFLGIAAGTPVPESDVEAEAFDIGYCKRDFTTSHDSRTASQMRLMNMSPVFRDLSYTGEYFAIAPAALGTCCKCAVLYGLVRRREKSNVILHR